MEWSARLAIVVVAGSVAPAGFAVWRYHDSLTSRSAIAVGALAGAAYGTAAAVVALYRHRPGEQLSVAAASGAVRRLLPRHRAVHRRAVGGSR